MRSMDARNPTRKSHEPSSFRAGMSWTHSAKRRGPKTYHSRFNPPRCAGSQPRGDTGQCGSTLKPFLPGLESALEDSEVSEIMINGPR